MKFTLQNIKLPNRHYIPAFVAQGTPYAFHLDRNERHYQVSDIAKHRTLAIDFYTYRECVGAIMTFCQAQEVAR